ncbi:MAG TPA: S16 family serine protease, partial [Actinomycetota bacterium]|nr:S16 family serine protease [Actinomycetota bacterium]
VAPPAGTAFAGEVALTGQVRPVPGMEQRLRAAKAAGCSLVFAPAALTGAVDGVRVVTVGLVADALRWGLSPAGTGERRRAS